MWILNKNGTWYEKVTNNRHKGHGRRRQWGYTDKDGVRQTRNAMVKRQRPRKGQTKQQEN